MDQAYQRLLMEIEFLSTHACVGDFHTMQARHLLFSSRIGMQQRMRRSPMTYLEEDGTYLPLFCFYEKIDVYDSRVLSTDPLFLPRRGGGTSEEWETRDAANQVCLKPLDPVTRRPDTLELTRTRTLTDAYNGSLPRNTRILTMPILIGEMDVVLTMPANMKPCIGARLELSRLVPGLLLHVRNYQLKVGDVVSLRLSPPKSDRRLFLIIDRDTDYNVGEPQAWIKGIMAIFQELRKLKIKQLIVTRPPDHEILPGWNEVASLLTDLREDSDAFEIVLAPGTFNSDPWLLSQDQKLITVLPQPGIRVPRLEPPIVTQPSLWSYPIMIADSPPRLVSSKGMVKYIYKRREIF